MYGSVYVQIKEAKKDSSSVCTFVGRSGKIICHTVFVTVLVGISMVLPMAMISVGVKYLSDCPVQRKIPVYLLVGGCFGILKILGTIWRNIHSRRYDNMDFFYDSHDSDAYSHHTYKLIDILLSLFLLSWLIAGSYWVFSIWKPNFKQILHDPRNWCDKTVYMFATYQIIGCYGFLGFVIIVGLSILFTEVIIVCAIDCLSFLEIIHQQNTFCIPENRGLNTTFKELLMEPDQAQAPKKKDFPKPRPTATSNRRQQKSHEKRETTEQTRTATTPTKQKKNTAGRELSQQEISVSPFNPGEEDGETMQKLLSICSEFSIDTPEDLRGILKKLYTQSDQNKSHQPRPVNSDPSARVTQDKKNEELSKLNNKTEKAEGRLKSAKKRIKELEIEVEKAKKEAEKNLKPDTKKLKEEIDQLKNRLSQLAGSKLTEGNPAIADLSDMNRPINLGEKFSELYDNQWTDAFEVLQDSGKGEEEVIRELVKILEVHNYKYFKRVNSKTKSKHIEKADSFGSNVYYQDAYTFCKEQSQEFHENLRKLMQPFGMKPERFCNERQITDESKLKTYAKQCAGLCWFMMVQDPPLFMDTTLPKKNKFDTDKFRAYTKTGKHIAYLVWPALYLHAEGPLLSKGVAQGK
ncbi:hypothetical protein FSP39_002391 [Pinctada imbricata]|uniref:Mitochondria-eating protein C-terminal domain-containing protein n=1 Tax=Pinctada imbricata TaxID=66713 RepID=A0AA89C8A9_PINIB|nr:hypothetical protein FSP39_002391 [Pinctada imbricata]